MSVYGTILTPHATELAVRAVLDPDEGGWLTHYLAAIEGQEGLAARTLGPVRWWEMVSDVSNWPDDRLPALLIVAGGTEQDPVRNADGSYREVLRVDTLTIVWDKTREKARTRAGYYAAAIKALVVQRLVRSSPDIADVVYRGYRTDPLAITDQRTIAAARVAFDVTVPDVVTDQAGLTVRPADPYADPGDTPAVDTADVTLTAL